LDVLQLGDEIRPLLNGEKADAGGYLVALGALFGGQENLRELVGGPSELTVVGEARGHGHYCYRNDQQDRDDDQHLDQRERGTLFR
jgi:hypothetical protein